MPLIAPGQGPDRMQQANQQGAEQPDVTQDGFPHDRPRSDCTGTETSRFSCMRTRKQSILQPTSAVASCHDPILSRPHDKYHDGHSAIVREISAYAAPGTP